MVSTSSPMSHSSTWRHSGRDPYSCVLNDLRSQLQESLGAAYSLDRELGGGGMSRVFVGTETGLGRAVVIKVIALELAGGMSAERFAREVKFAARLQQANIVPMLSAGDANGLPYYTMPFVRGESLRTRISRGDPITVTESISILRDVARALSYAHGEGVVHRDIKPENILLSGGTAVVTDFGIAKALSVSRTVDGSSLTSEGITQLGSSIGTPAYMAPEQAAGDPNTDHRADIYAWGVIAWELLAGRHPFASRTTPQALLAAHMSEQPEALTKVRAGLPSQVSGLVARCLEKDPARRPASAAELLATLDTAATPSDSENARAHRGGPRPRRAVFAAVAVVLVAAVAIGSYMRRSAAAATANMARTIVVVPFDNLGAAGDAEFADGVTTEIAGQLARVPGLQVVARASVKKFRGSSIPPQEIARQLGAAYALSGTVRYERGPNGAGPNEAKVRIVPSLVRASDGEQLWGEPLQEDLADVFTAQADIAEKVASALSVTIGATERAALRRPGTRDQKAREAVTLGFALEEKRGLPNIRDALVQFNRAIARDSSYALAWAGRAEAYNLLPAYLDTTMSAKTASAIVEQSARRALALDSLLPEAYVALAGTLIGRPNDALHAVDRAIALDPNSAMALTRRGTILLLLGRVAEAEAPLRRAVALDPLVAANTARLDWWFMATGRNDSATALRQHATELEPTNTMIAYLGAVVSAHAGRLDDAISGCAAYSGRREVCKELWTGLIDPRQGRRTLALLDDAGRKSGEMILTLPSFRALGYARLGATDSAFAALRQVAGQRDNESICVDQFAVVQAAAVGSTMGRDRWRNATTVITPGQSPHARCRPVLPPWRARSGTVPPDPWQVRA